MTTSTYDGLVWDIGRLVPEEFSEHNAETCDYVLCKLEEEGIDIETPIPPEELARAIARVRSFFGRALMHKKSERNHAPSKSTIGPFCDSLEAILAKQTVPI